MKETILQAGGACPDLLVYAHIDGSILRPVVPTVTKDAFVTLFAGAGTSAYKGAFGAGWRSYLHGLEGRLGHPVARSALITWSAGSQCAMEACADADPPDAVVMLDGLYGGKPKGSTMGDGQVLDSPGLDAVTRCATAAARRETSPRGTERVFVLFHSRIPTPYASSKECAEHVQARVEAAVGQKMAPATDVRAELLDGHFFVEALALGNLRIVEFAGATAGEHIREAHLWDEAAKLWIPWLGSADLCSASTTVWSSPLLRVLDVTTPLMRGEDVRAWQLFLVNQGLELDVDAVFGPKTSAKTQVLQRAYSLAETGALDAATFHVAHGAGYVQPASPTAIVSMPPPLRAEDAAPVASSLVTAVLARARRDLGIAEDLGHNDGRRIREMGRRFGVAPGSNWCALAVSDWIVGGAADAQVAPPVTGSPGALALMGQFKAAGRWVAASEARLAPSLVTAGMVPVWDRADLARPDTFWWGHTGLTTGGVANGHFPTIEGNSGPDGAHCAEMSRDLADARLFGFGRLA